MRPAWLCGFCEAHFLSEAAAMRHEAGCDDNPANRTCATCRHLMLDGREHDDGVDMGCNRGLKPWAKGCPKWGEGKRHGN